MNIFEKFGGLLPRFQAIQPSSDNLTEIRTWVTASADKRFNRWAKFVTYQIISNYSISALLLRGWLFYIHNQINCLIYRFKSIGGFIMAICVYGQDELF